MVGKVECERDVLRLDSDRIQEGTRALRRMYAGEVRECESE